jgi:hypothetical protein
MVEILGINNSSIYTDTGPHFSWSTFTISVSVAFLTSFIIPMYVVPFFKTSNIFKQNLVETWVHLRFHCNLYSTPYAKSMLTRPEYFEDVLAAKNDLRKCWVNIEKSYYLIPRLYRWFLVMIRFLPTQKDLDDMFGDILAISNSTSIYDTIPLYN